jgi:hypothetical protein
MSALPPKADIAERDRHVRFVSRECRSYPAISFLKRMCGKQRDDEPWKPPQSNALLT